MGAGAAAAKARAGFSYSKPDASDPSTSLRATSGRFHGAILRGSYLGNLAVRGFFRSPGSESRATNLARGYRFAARMLRDISQMQTWLRKRVEN